jgi:transposase-like protein
MKRRRFTPEYKQEALQLAQQSDIPIAQVAKTWALTTTF